MEDETLEAQTKIEDKIYRPTKIWYKWIATYENDHGITRFIFSYPSLYALIEGRFQLNLKS